MDGILNINKPQGVTSFDVVAVVKRLIGQRRVGHAGTLDPAASGVLPVCFGGATRVIEFLAEASKAYQADIELGVVTDTYDASGRIIEKKDPSQIRREQFELALASFCGLIQQIPPMYSAVKHRGQPLYELARQGIEVERKPRLAKVYSLKLVSWQPPLAAVEVVCGRGTYVRSLAHDIGRSLGCGACLRSLTRVRYGTFDIREAITISHFEEAVRYGYWQYFVHPLDSVLLDWAAMIVGTDTGQAISNGRPLSRFEPPPSFENRCRAYTLDGCFLGILRFNVESKQWQPQKVFGGSAATSG